MRSKSFLVFGPIFLAAILVSGCMGDLFWDFGHYSVDVERYFDTEDEMRAIEVAENLNYTDYTSLQRWEDSWANYIDSEVIDHYNASYHQDMENEREADVTFRYYAWAEFYPEMDLHLTGVSSTLSVRLNGEDPFHVNDSSEIYYDLSYDEIFLGHTENGSWSVDKYSSVGGGVPSDTEVDLDLHLNNSYFVKMYLSYDDIWGSLAAI
ncbi:MAG: hypothetical protein ACMUHU_03740 [Thermoplasmatota archaeon]